MARQTTSDRINCRIELIICGIIFLYSQEEQIAIIGTGLQKFELIYNKG